MAKFRGRSKESQDLKQKRSQETSEGRMDDDHQINNIKTSLITDNMIKRNHKEQRRFHSVLKDERMITEIILSLCS